MIKGIFDNPLELIEVTQDNFKECKDFVGNCLCDVYHEHLNKKYEFVYQDGFDWIRVPVGDFIYKYKIPNQNKTKFIHITKEMMDNLFEINCQKFSKHLN